MLNALSLSLPPVPTAGQVARAAIRDGFTGTLAPDTLADLELVVSELVTNAIEHGQGAIEVRLDHDDGALRGSVSDQGQGFRYEARDFDRDHDRLRGRGLSIVSALVTRWGIEDGSTHVWFEIARSGTLRRLLTLRFTRSSSSNRGRRSGSCSRASSTWPRSLRSRTSCAISTPTGLERVIVDIREVTFFDTTGLNLATRLDGWGRDHGIPVMFTRGAPAVANALEAAGLALALTFTDAPADQLPPQG